MAAASARCQLLTRPTARANTEYTYNGHITGRWRVQSQDEVAGGGDFMNRPGMASMLKFMSRQIFGDLKLFARHKVFHMALRQRLATYYASVECLNFKFEDKLRGQIVTTVTSPTRALLQQKRPFRVPSSTQTGRLRGLVGRERIRGVTWLARGGHQGKFLKQAFCPSVQIDTRIATSARLSVSPIGTSPCHQSPCVSNVPA